MILDVIAATNLQDLLAPKERGERVNAHVLIGPQEPKPDFEAMRKVIQGGHPEQASRHRDESPRREVTKID